MSEHDVTHVRSAVAHQQRGRPLDGRELVILQLASRGYSPQRIAALLGIDVRDVEHTLDVVVVFFNAADRSAALTRARDLGLIL